jgi:Uma2 family endonuclease
MTTILSENNHTAPIYPKSRYITWEQFRGKYLSREDGYKYEWANGRVVKTRSSMGPRQIPIFVSLNRLLNRPEITSRYSGYLTAEIDLKLGADIHRRPDFAWFSDEQIHILATEKDAIQIPSLVIEVISPGDEAVKVLAKVEMYLELGVKVVWLIYPESRKVQVFPVDTPGRTALCSGSMLCDASPALPGFGVLASEIVG